jgi:hypothetical protein
MKLSSFWIAWSVIVVAACGRVDSTTDGGSDSAADVLGCSYQVCDDGGSTPATCPVNQTCSVGDGCNICICQTDDAGKMSLQCTGRNCSCSDPADF